MPSDKTNKAHGGLPKRSNHLQEENKEVGLLPFHFSSDEPMLVDEAGADADVFGNDNWDDEDMDRSLSLRRCAQKNNLGGRDNGLVPLLSYYSCSHPFYVFRVAAFNWKWEEPMMRTTTMMNAPLVNFATDTTAAGIPIVRTTTIIPRRICPLPNEATRCPVPCAVFHRRYPGAAVGACIIERGPFAIF
jgi:hypothetical protein